MERHHIMAHIVGIDEIRKAKLIKFINDNFNNIGTIDLDRISQQVYNESSIVNKKKNWEKLTNNLFAQQKKKQRDEVKISELKIKRNDVRKTIYELWVNNISKHIKKHIGNFNNVKYIFLIGYHIFPKDFRVKMKFDKPANTIIYKYSQKIYAANQIKYYLRTYEKKIIQGEFPHTLLNFEYLTSRYDKLIGFYEKLGYQIVTDDINKVIEKLIAHQIKVDALGNATIFVALPYRSDKVIIGSDKMPIYGHLDRDDAIKNITSKIKNPIPIYVYELESKNFSYNNQGLLVATCDVYPLVGESTIAIDLNETTDVS